MTTQLPNVSALPRRPHRPVYILGKTRGVVWDARDAESREPEEAQDVPKLEGTGWLALLLQLSDYLYTKFKNLNWAPIGP